MIFATRVRTRQASNNGSMRMTRKVNSSRLFECCELSQTQQKYDFPFIVNPLNGKMPKKRLVLLQKKKKNYFLLRCMDQHPGVSLVCSNENICIRHKWSYWSNYSISPSLILIVVSSFSESRKIVAKCSECFPSIKKYRDKHLQNS